MVVDASHNVLNIALAGSSQNDLANAVGVEMTRQTILVSPYAGIIDYQAFMDTMRLVINVFRGICVYDLDLITVGYERLSLFIHPYRAIEGTVHRIPAQ